MEISKKYRKCPHCKSTKGFSVDVLLGGTHSFEVSFNGKILKEKRDGSDTIENYASCLNCGKSITTENLKIESV